MARGSLSSPEVLKILKRCVLTAWGGDNTADTEAKELFDKSGLKDGNTFVLLLNPEGQLVHGFRSYYTGGRNPTYLQEEFAKGLAKLNLPGAEVKWTETYEGLKLPDVKGSGAPSGMRLFVRTDAEGRGKNVIVEAVPLSNEQKKALAYPEQPKEVDAEALKGCLVQLYPAAIRAAEQQKSFKKVTGSLKLQPAGSDPKSRYAILSGPIRLAGEESDSSMEGSLQMVLSYGLETPDVRTVRGVAEGTFRYSVHGRRSGEMKISAALESRPE